MLNQVRRSRVVLALLGPAVALTSTAALALAAWSATGAGTGSAAALTMPSGSAPTARVSGTDVTATWPAATFANGASVAGYRVNRYNATTGALQTVGPGCSGTVTTVTCIEQGVPSGVWIYTDTPVQLSWAGTESPASSSVTVR